MLSFRQGRADCHFKCPRVPLRQGGDNQTITREKPDWGRTRLRVDTTIKRCIYLSKGVKEKTGERMAMRSK